MEDKLNHCSIAPEDLIPQSRRAAAGKGCSFSRKLAWCQSLSPDLHLLPGSLPGAKD